MKKKVKKKDDCEHLNVGQTLIEGQEVAICKDCGDHVDMAKFDAPKAPADELLPFIKSGREITKVVTYSVDNVVKLPKLDGFFPVFGCQPGDILVVYRQK